MQTVREIAQGIVEREGGFVNDPSDPGGATNFGVTIGTMRRLGLDLNRDGLVDEADVRLVDADLAEQIFIDHYFKGPQIDLLPGPLQAPVFDMYVNAGSNAIRILQKLLNAREGRVSVDGVLGPQTIRAAHHDFDVRGWAPDLVNAYGEARRAFYYAIGDARPASRKYARRRDGGKGGWITRAEEFMDPKYRLTDAQHRARVRAWV